jgi:hypothetical protein
MMLAAVPPDEISVEVYMYCWTARKLLNAVILGPKSTRSRVPKQTEMITTAPAAIQAMLERADGAPTLCCASLDSSVRLFQIYCVLHCVYMYAVLRESHCMIKKGTGLHTTLLPTTAAAG